MQQRQVSEKVLLLAIVVSMFLWGLSWPSGKVLTNYCSVINFTVYRYAIVVITMIILLVATKVRIRMKKAGIPYALAAGSLLALYSYFFFMGLKSGSAGAGGVLVTTLNPIMAYMVGIILSRKIPARNELAGLALGTLAGCVLLKVWGNTSAIVASGNLYFLAAALTWAVMSKFTSKGAVFGSSLSFSLWQYLITLLCLVPFTNVPELQAAIHIKDAVFWGNLFFGSAIVTSLATTVFFYSTTQLGAEKASSYIFLVPLAAAISSWLILGEKIMVHTIAGGLLGMTAVYMINKKPSSRVTETAG